MKMLPLGLVIVALARIEAQTMEVALAPNQASDLFGGRKHELSVVVYAAPQKQRELRAQLFQIAGTLVASIAQPDPQPLVIEPREGISHPAVFFVELPKVARTTRFLVRFEGAGAIRLTGYPESLLQPLRELAEKDVRLFTLASAGDLARFLEREAIPATAIGANVPPDFSERGIILARKESDTPQLWPARLRQGQALVVFHPLAPDEWPRIVAAPLGDGVLIQVRMNLIEKMPDRPRAQEIFAEIIDLARTQINRPP